MSNSSAGNQPMNVLEPQIEPAPIPETDGLRPPDANTDDQTNLSLVLDVELNVLLRFGQRQLTLREILDLTCGSVIELDRRVDDPVELLLDGRVIARGEAAIVDGNYGLRVTEILPSAVAGQLAY